MSTDQKMSGGLLDGFDNVMAGLNADDVERANQSEPVSSESVSPEPIWSEAGPHGASTTRLRPTTGVPVARALDPRSVALARRILGTGLGTGFGTGTGTHTDSGTARYADPGISPAGES